MRKAGGSRKGGKGGIYEGEKGGKVLLIENHLNPLNKLRLRTFPLIRRKHLSLNFFAFRSRRHCLFLSMTRCKIASHLLFTPFLDTFLTNYTLIFASPGLLLLHDMTIYMGVNTGNIGDGFIASRL